MVGKHALIVCLVCIGVVKSAEAAAATQQTLHGFCQAKHCTDGIGPHTLAIDGVGNLYGTTMFGGTHGYGTVYEYTPATGAYSVLYSFCAEANCSDGRWPFRVKLVIDAAGNLYGTASQGGNSNDVGVVFKLSHGASGWQYQVLYTFCAQANCVDGGTPATGLTYVGAVTGSPYDGAAPLYGTTEFRGAHDRGVVFELKPQSGRAWTERVLYAFCPDGSECPDGTNPRVPLTADGAGNLYGATEIGGKHGNGVAFRLAPRGRGFSYRVLHHFCSKDSCTDGASPYSELLMDGAGNLLGAATDGGAANKGLLYKLVPQGRHWGYSILTTFDANPGMRPVDLVLGNGSILFGVTSDGGSGFGDTVFRFDGTLDTLYSFCSEPHCSDGDSPAGIVIDGAGNLFGVTEDRGHRHAGTIFEVSP